MAIINLTKDNYQDTVSQNEIIVFDFWAEWCGPCKQFGPVFEKVSEQYPNVTFCKVNVEEQEELASMFQVRSIPTIVFMRDNIVVFSNPGAIPEAPFAEGIDKLVELDMEQVHKDLAAAQAEHDAQNS